MSAARDPMPPPSCGAKAALGLPGQQLTGQMPWRGMQGGAGAREEAEGGVPRGR